MKRLGTADRFKLPTPLNPVCAYEGVFTRKRKTPVPPTIMPSVTPLSDQNGFGVSTKRFAGHLGNNISEMKNYSPVGANYYRRNTTMAMGRSTPYEIPDPYTKRLTPVFSFGFGRDDMARIHID